MLKFLLDVYLGKKKEKIFLWGSGHYFTSCILVYLKLDTNTKILQMPSTKTALILWPKLTLWRKKPTRVGKEPVAVHTWKSFLFYFFLNAQTHRNHSQVNHWVYAHHIGNVTLKSWETIAWTAHCYSWLLH